MTEEAIMYFKFHREIFCEDYLKNLPKDSIAYQATIKEQKFYDMAIKALEQEPILDKIKAEILAEMQYHSGSGDEVVQAYADGLHNSLRIIDKCRAESEGKK